MITGRYFTNLQRPPYPLPEHKTRSVWRSSSTGTSGGFNELMFEDKAGHELVYLHAERDESVVVKRNASRSVGGDQGVSVGGGRRVSVGADYELRCQGEKARIEVERGELDLSAVRTVIEARKELVLEVGKARLTLGPEGITIAVGETKLSIDAAGVRSNDSSTRAPSGEPPVAVLGQEGGIS